MEKDKKETLVEKYTRNKFEKMSKQIDSFIKNCCESDFVKPKITGEITKGKLRYRGIFLEQQETNKGILYRVYQRKVLLGSLFFSN